MFRKRVSFCLLGGVGWSSRECDGWVDINDLILYCVSWSFRCSERGSVLVSECR